MVDLIPDGTLASWAVAVGTLLLAVVAYYEARLLVRERKANQARELVEKIYLPIRKEIVLWLEPEKHDYSVWPKLQEDYPHLTPFLPEELIKLLDRAGPIMLRLGTLELEINELVSKASIATQEKMGLHGPVGGPSSPAFCAVRLGQPRFNMAMFYVKDLWLSRKSLKDYSTQQIEKRWPGMHFDTELYLDGARVGGSKEAQDLVEGVLESLAAEPKAKEYRDNVDKKLVIVERALPIIYGKIEKSMGTRKSRWARITSPSKRKQTLFSSVNLGELAQQVLEH
jgi:hypothetical protein